MLNNEAKGNQLAMKKNLEDVFEIEFRIAEIAGASSERHQILTIAELQTLAPFVNFTI